MHTSGCFTSKMGHRALQLVLLTICLAVLCKCSGQPNMIEVSADINGFQKLICSSSRLKSNTYLNLSISGYHQVSSSYSKFCIIENVVNITIASSSPSSNAIINCQTSDFGFGFLNVTNLSILRISISECGGRLTPSAVKYDNNSNSFFYFPCNQYSVLFFSHVNNLIVKSVFITRYKGYGMLIINSLEESSIDDVKVQKSLQCTNSSHFSCSGSGILAYFHDYVSSSFLRMPDSNSLVIAHTEFYLGQNFPPVNTCLTNDFHLAQSFPLVSAAALTAIFAQTKFEANVNISNSKIHANYGQIGSGILLLFKGSFWMSMVRMRNINSSKNCILKSDCPGSFIRIVFDPLPNSCSRCSKTSAIPVISVLDSSTSGETCHTAVYITTTYTQTDKAEIQFINFSCTRAKSLQKGICFTAEQLYWPGSPRGSLYIILRSILANQNTIATLQDFEAMKPTPSNDHLVSGIFTFINLGLVIIEGTDDMPAIFSDNSASTIMAYTTDIKLIGHIKFEGNKVNNGAAFLLNGFSHLVLTENLTVTFAHKHAIIHGAAIAALTTGTEDSICVFQLETMEKNFSRISELINITFASSAGSFAVEVYPLYDCVQYSALINPTNMVALYRHIFHGDYHLLSTADQVCFCKTNGSKPCQAQVGDSTNNTFSSGHLSVFTGSNFSIMVITQDGGGSATNTTVFSHLSPLPGQKHVHAKLDILGHTIYNNGCQGFDYSIYFKHNQNEDYVVYLELSAASMPTTLRIRVVVLSCPSGFEQAANGTCVCGTFFKQVNNFTNPNIECSVANNATKITIPPYSWIGRYIHRNCTNSSCPLAFARICFAHCNSKTNTTNLEHVDSLCALKRTGQLCGDCPEGLSVVFGSLACKPCSNWWLLSILVYGIVGVLLVVFLFAFRFTMDQGTVGGLIFYGNIASIGLIILHSSQTNYYSYLLVFLSIINLDLGYPLCFYNGMNDVVKSGMQFVFPMYVWLIVAIIVFVSHYSVTVSNLISNRAVQVLITLIHLSYAKILATVIDIFSQTELHIENQTSIRVWFTSGSVEYGHAGHGVLLALAVLFTVGFIIPYTVAVLFVPFCWRCTIVNYFRPFFETLYYPYKESLRYWFGVRLIVLLSLFMVHAIASGANVFIEVFSQELIILLFTLVQTWKNPFRNSAIGLLDLIYLTNITLIYCVGTYYVPSNNFLSPSCIWAIRSLIFMVFVTFCLTLIYHFLMFCLPLKLPIFKVAQEVNYKINKILKFLTDHNQKSSDHVSVTDEDVSVREPLLESN